MSRAIVGRALALALALAGPSAAYAQANDSTVGGQGQGPGRGQPQRMGNDWQQRSVTGGLTQGTAMDPRKQLIATDTYLRGAITGTKLVYENGQLASARADATLEREAVSNVDRSINLALSHVNQLRALPSAQMPESNQLGVLQTHLLQARAQVAELRRTIGTPDRAGITAATSRLYGALRAADEELGQIADSESLTRIERIEVPERQPVGGSPKYPMEQQPMEPSPMYQAPSQPQPLYQPPTQPQPMYQPPMQQRQPQPSPYGNQPGD